jgi:hypothetical protein
LKFTQASKALAAEMGASKQQTEREIALIQSQQDKTNAKLDSDRDVAIGKTRARIEAALRQRQELSERYRKEADVALAKAREELELRASENAKAKSTLLAQKHRGGEALSDTITDLSRKVNELEVRTADAQGHQGDAKRMEQCSGKLRALDENIETAFNGFYTMVHEAPAKVEQFEAAAAPASKRSGNSSVSRGSRRENSRVVTPVESKQRKRTPIVTNGLAP